ncbi:MAG: hypothetical protein EXQ71_03480 [Acidimicrobiia bacterium]|nr:hypothetical protein [Acidimicrobiia bacterium]
MTLHRAALVLVLGATLLLASCADESVPTGTVPTLVPRNVYPKKVITVDDAGFDASAVEIVSGQVLVIVNTGDEPHSFSSTERFDTGLLDPGTTSTVLLTKPGKIRFFDKANRDHKGTVTVTTATDIPS